MRRRLMFTLNSTLHCSRILQFVHRQVCHCLTNLLNLIGCGSSEPGPQKGRDWFSVGGAPWVIFQKHFWFTSAATCGSGHPPTSQSSARLDYALYRTNEQRIDYVACMYCNCV